MRSGAPCVIVFGSIFGCLWLVLSWRRRQKLGKLGVRDQVLLVWGRGPQRLQFNFLGRRLHSL